MNVQWNHVLPFAAINLHKQYRGMKENAEKQLITSLLRMVRCGCLGAGVKVTSAYTTKIVSSCKNDSAGWGAVHVTRMYVRT